ncbi:hypothetical protein EDD21DRAFT_365651, partial [Dissophora ornata]
MSTQRAIATIVILCTTWTLQQETRAMLYMQTCGQPETRSYTTDIKGSTHRAPSSPAPGVQWKLVVSLGENRVQSSIRCTVRCSGRSGWSKAQRPVEPLFLSPLSKSSFFPWSRSHVHRCSRSSCGV